MSLDDIGLENDATQATRVSPLFMNSGTAAPPAFEQWHYCTSGRLGGMGPGNRVSKGDNVMKTRGLLDICKDFLGTPAIFYGDSA